MNTLFNRWPKLKLLVMLAAQVGAHEVWLFGSALHSPKPRDLDVLVVYTDREVPRTLRSLMNVELLNPPIDLIAMTPDEVVELRFLEKMLATRLYP